MRRGFQKYGLKISQSTEQMMIKTMELFKSKMEMAGPSFVITVIIISITLLGFYAKNWDFSTALQPT